MRRRVVRGRRTTARPDRAARARHPARAAGMSPARRDPGEPRQQGLEEHLPEHQRPDAQAGERGADRDRGGQRGRAGVGGSVVLEAHLLLQQGQRDDRQPVEGDAERERLQHERVGAGREGRQERSSEQRRCEPGSEPAARRPPQRAQHLRPAQARADDERAACACADQQPGDLNHDHGRRHAAERMGRDERGHEEQRAEPRQLADDMAGAHPPHAARDARGAAAWLRAEPHDAHRHVTSPASRLTTAGPLRISGAAHAAAGLVARAWRLVREQMVLEHVAPRRPTTA